MSRIKSGLTVKSRSNAWHRRLPSMLFAALLSAQAFAQPVLTHIDGLDQSDEVAISGDGQWLTGAQNTPPVVFVHEVATGVEIALDLRSQLSDPDLDFANIVPMVLNHDGTVIAFNADGPEGNRGYEIPMAIGRDGTELIRVAATRFGDKANFDSYLVMDPTGRYLAFTTEATALSSVVNGQSIGQAFPSGNLDEAWWLDRDSGEFRRIAIRPGGNEVNDYSYAYGISEDGRYVLFGSDATNLPGGDGSFQLYLRDMSQTGNEAITHISLAPDGSALPDVDAWQKSLSAAGDRAVFTSEIDGEYAMLVWEADPASLVSGPVTGSTKILERLVDDGSSYLRPAFLSANGRWFTSRQGENPEGQRVARINTISGSDYVLPETSPWEPGADFWPWGISANGSRIIFTSDDLSLPPGEVGAFWLLDYVPLPDVTIFKDSFEADP